MSPIKSFRNICKRLKLVSAAHPPNWNNFVQSAHHNTALEITITIGNMVIDDEDDRS